MPPGASDQLTMAGCFAQLLFRPGYAAGAVERAGMVTLLPPRPRRSVVNVSLGES